MGGEYMFRISGLLILGFVAVAGSAEFARAQSTATATATAPQAIAADEPKTQSKSIDAILISVAATSSTAPSGSVSAPPPPAAANGPAASSRPAAAKPPSGAANAPAASIDSTAAKSYAWAWPSEPLPSLQKMMPDIPGLRLTGAIGIWGRSFPQSPQWDGESNAVLWPNVEGWVKAEYSWNGGKDRFNFMPYARKDFIGSRSLVDVKEGYFLHTGDGWSVLAGINTVHWGVTESRHLVNIINQADYAWSIDGDELLGQPMVNANFTTSMGTLSLYGLFGFRPLQDYDAKDRFRTPLVPDGHTILASDIEQNVNFAGRFNSTFPLFGGSIDAAVSYFNGVGREPRYVLLAATSPSSLPRLTSYYDLINQGGLEIVGTFNSLQLKFEGIIRHEYGETYAATVAGFEYTFFNVWNSGADVGLVAEHLTDNRSMLQPPTFYAHDVFIGGRFTFNDSSDTNLLGGILYNYQDSAEYATARLSTRIRDDLSLTLEGRYFIYAPPEDYLYWILHDSYVQARIIKYF